MPSCDTCDKFFNPATLDAGGMCPQCGTEVIIGDMANGLEEEPVKVPWHFWVGVG